MNFYLEVNIQFCKTIDVKISPIWDTFIKQKGIIQPYKNRNSKLQGISQTQKSKMDKAENTEGFLEKEIRYNKKNLIFRGNV